MHAGPSLWMGRQTNLVSGRGGRGLLECLYTRARSNLAQPLASLLYKGTQIRSVVCSRGKGGEIHVAFYRLTGSVVIAGSAEYFAGPRQALFWMCRRRGFSGVYRGYTVFVVRDVPASVIYVAVYQLLYDYLYIARSVGHVEYTD